MHFACRRLGRIGFIGAVLVASIATARQPNILLILADDVGREVLGCYGGTSYDTPQIDRLARGGMRFEHFYAMAVCYPTRTTLLTGRYPFRLGHPDWGSFPRDLEQHTLPALLKKAGYSTAVAGKWQLAMLKDDVEQPHRMGFDEYCLYGWHEGPWYYQPHIRQNTTLRTDVKNRYGPDVICDFVIDFIERHKDGPFFAFYSMSLCHAETNDLEEPAPYGPHGRYDTYAEMVGKMDERVGRVVAALDRLGLRQSTLIIFTTDNGTAAQNLIRAENGQYIYEDVVSKLGDREVPGGNGTLTDAGTRVPMILNWPGTIEALDVNHDLSDVSDILPSLADVGSITLPEEVKLDGHSMIGQLRNYSALRRWAFAEHEGKCFVRNQRWKLYHDGRFYDLESDPNEKNPLLTDNLAAGAAEAHHVLRDAMKGLNYRPPPPRQ